MKRFRLGGTHLLAQTSRRNPRTSRITFGLVAAGAALLLAACSSSSSSSSSSATTPATGASTSSSASTSGNSSSALTPGAVQQLQGIVSQAEAVPTFTPPGPAFNTKNLAGKKIFVMPTASQLPVCNQIANDIVSLASKFGMTGTNFQNDGGASSWIPGLNQAISQHYSAIVLVCGIDPNLIKPQLAAAKAAGIAVIDSGLGDTGAPQGPNAMSPLVTAQTNIPNIPAMNASVDKGLLDNANGKPFDIFLITSNDVPDGVLMDNALEANIAKYCPSCKIKTDNIPVPDWATQVQSAVSSAVLADPNLKMVITTFDGEDPPALAGLKAAHRSDVKIYGNYGGTPAYINQMGQGVAMGDDVGPSHLWRAYATMDQVLRLLAGVPAVLPSKDEDPSRLFTPQNYSQVNGVNDGFGTSFVTGYDKIWGIS